MGINYYGKSYGPGWASPDIVRLSVTDRSGALALESAVSSAIASATGAATGSIGAGWMSSGTVGTLSASYSSLTASIV